MSAVDREVLAGPTLGAVDLVAIDRALHGLPTTLSEADWAHLHTRIEGVRGEFEAIAKALGVSRDMVERRHYRWRRASAPPS